MRGGTVFPIKSCRAQDEKGCTKKKEKNNIKTKKNADIESPPATVHHHQAPNFPTPKTSAKSRGGEVKAGRETNLATLLAPVHFPNRAGPFPNNKMKMKETKKRKKKENVWLINPSQNINSNASLKWVPINGSPTQDGKNELG